jgi:mannitol/fructose-specific phosphotransferase system IIA component (Ntr-type)
MKSSPHSSYLSDYLKPSQIIYDLKAKDKVQALEELLDVLAKPEVDRE